MGSAGSVGSWAAARALSTANRMAVQRAIRAGTAQPIPRKANPQSEVKAMKLPTFASSTRAGSPGRHAPTFPPGAL